MTTLDRPRLRGPDRVELRHRVARLFSPAPATPLVGVEVEALALDANTRRPVPPTATSGAGAALAPALASWAKERGWTAARSAAGTPAYAGPDGRAVSFEPGGQLEYASAPVASLTGLEADLLDVLPSLALALASEGIELVARGVDPLTPLSDARLCVADERYRRMSTHYARWGPWGRRMMRQTAALHINIDAPGPPFESWTVANAAVPALLAAFANSPVVEGAASGHRSVRAAQWRHLDPTRTGIVPGTGDAVDEYLDFALGADAFLLGSEREAARPFEAHLGQATDDDWRRHLTTLFPEVRPRGYLEVRSVDALPLHLLALPVALLVGLLFDDQIRARAHAALPRPAPGHLERAGRLGLADPEVADGTQRVFDLGIEGLKSLSPEIVGPGLVARIERFRSSFTDQALDPGHRRGDRLVGDDDALSI